MTTTTTEQLVSQLVMAAQWDYEDDETQPVSAAASMLGVAPTDPRLDQVRAVVAGVDGLSWAERVGLAAHLLLVDASWIRAAA